MATQKERGRPPKPKAEMGEPEEKIKTEVVEKTTVVLLDKEEMRRKRTDLNPEPFAVFDQASTLGQRELQAYSDGMRIIKQTVERTYKNYVGIYDQPIDPYTKRKKIFTPLTHNIVDSVSKSVKIDHKAIHIVPLTNESRGKAKVLNMVLPYFFQQMGFDTLMDDFIHRLAWFGGQVTIQDWLYEESEETTEKKPTTELMNGFPDEKEIHKETRTVKTDKPRIRLTNVLDIFLPATAESLNWAVRNASVIVRSVLPLNDVIANPAYNSRAKSNLTGWTYETANMDDSSSLNKMGMSGYANQGLSKTYWNPELQMSSNPFITIYERYGRIPKSWVTGDSKDALTNVPGIISYGSNNGQPKDLVTLGVRYSPFGDYGPFEEAHYNKLPNRWMGEGLGERLIPLQAYHNEIVNNRRNNELLVQHRMFVYRKGSLDPSQLYARPGGGIAVDNVNDIVPLSLPDVSQSSFAEDSSIESAAQRLAGVALTPIQKKVTATESQNIQVNSNLTYNELRDAVEKYLERLVLKHLIPLLKRYFTAKKTIPVQLSMEDLQVLDTYNGYAPFISQQMGTERFLVIDDRSIFDGDFAVTVDIDAVPMSRQARAAALTNMLALGAKIQNSGMNIPATFKKIAELNGIVDDRMFENAQPAVPSGVTNPQDMAQMGQPAGMPMAPQTSLPPNPQQAPSMP